VIISDSSTVVALSGQVAECLEWEALENLDHLVELSHRDPQVRVVEVVVAVPA